MEISGRIELALAEGLGLGTSAGAAIVLLSRMPRRIEDLSTILGLSHSATVRLVDRLESSGLAARTPGDDRRSVKVVVSEDGRRRVDELFEHRERVLEDVLALLRADERRTLSILVERLLEELTTDWPTARHICRLCSLEKCESCVVCPTWVGAERER
jgi:MarR family transcriptional repressor of emrRAB